MLKVEETTEKRGRGRPPKSTTAIKKTSNDATNKATNDALSAIDFNNLLADIESKLKASFVDLIAQAMAPLRSLINDRVQALNNKLNAFETEVRLQIDQLASDLDHLRSSSSRRQSNEPETAAANTLPVSNTTTLVSRPDTNLNLVIYGIQESRKGSPKHIRAEEDLESVTTTLSNIDDAIDDYSIRDCIRLGKYKENARSPRPILAKLFRPTDVSRLLSKRSKLQHPIVIKPDMTPTQRSQEAILLKQRWLLMQSGTPKQSIKIRKDKLFLNGRPHGQAVDSEYKLLPLVSDLLFSPNNKSDASLTPTTNTSSVANTQSDASSSPTTSVQPQVNPSSDLSNND